MTKNLLIAEVFKELAVLRGKRSPTGKWEKDIDIPAFRNLLQQAATMVEGLESEEALVD